MGYGRTAFVAHIYWGIMHSSVELKGGGMVEFGDLCSMDILWAWQVRGV